MGGQDVRRLGLQWQSALTNTFTKDGDVGPVTFAYGFRDVTLAITSPWHWNLNESPLPDGVAYEQVSAMRFIFKFKDVADYRVVHERVEVEAHDGDETCVDSYSLLDSPWVSRQAILMWSEIDQDAEGIRVAHETHGGAFHSVRMELVGGTFISLVFRDCHCRPSDWAAFDAWSGYPLPPYVMIPTARVEPLATTGRSIRDHRRRLCTTRITQRSTTSPDVDVLYLCEDCLDDWVRDYAPGHTIPRTESGSGGLPTLHGDEQSWERGRYPGKKCQCEYRRSID